MPALPSRGSAAPAALSRAGASPVLALVLSVALSLVLLPAAGCTQAADPVVTGAFGARPAVVLPSGAPPTVPDAWSDPSRIAARRVPQPGPASWSRTYWPGG